MDKDTVIIIGDSPFLKEVEGSLKYVLDRYISIGINAIVKRYQTNIHAFVDPLFLPLTSTLVNTKTVSLKRWGDLVRNKNKELYDSFSFDFRKHGSEDIVQDGKLAWCGFTHDYAVSYCILKGFKRVILIGTADFTQGPHYVHGDPFKCSDTLKVLSKKFIEDICSKRVDVLTCNPNSLLSVPRVNIEDLLK